MSEITTKNLQSVLDIAMQELGSAESAFELAEANGLLLSDELSNGQPLKLTTVADSQAMKQYEANNLLPSTAITAEQYTETIGGEGIEFWAIEYDFVVS